MQTIQDAVLSGAASDPVDVRYAHCGEALGPKELHKSAEVFSYLQTLYDSVAETLPDTFKSSILLQKCNSFTFKSSKYL